MIIKYKELLQKWQSLWFSDYKAFGWEVINGPLAVVIARLEYTKECIGKYLSGKIDRIEVE